MIGVAQNAWTCLHLAAFCNKKKPPCASMRPGGRECSSSRAWLAIISDPLQKQGRILAHLRIAGRPVPQMTKYEVTVPAQANEVRRVELSRRIDVIRHDVMSLKIPIVLAAGALATLDERGTQRRPFRRARRTAPDHRPAPHS